MQAPPPVHAFQSTRPMRGGTVWQARSCYPFFYFNPPAPCGAGPLMLRGLTRSVLISIHPPHAGRDIFTDRIRFPARDFNPPAPCGAGLFLFLCFRGAGHFNPPAPCGAGRRGSVYKNPWRYISIHPPRAGRDKNTGRLLLHLLDFNPPAPCGAGQPNYHKCSNLSRFQSTRPVRGGTL